MIVTHPKTPERLARYLLARKLESMLNAGEFALPGATAHEQRGIDAEIRRISSRHVPILRTDRERTLLGIPPIARPAT